MSVALVSAPACSCGRPATLRRRTLCHTCYERRRRSGDLQVNASKEERFFEKVEAADPLECWIWTGALDIGGYGAFNADGRVKSHRWSYQFLRGEIPSDLVLDHLCRRPACVNPWHLEPVSNAENCRRGAGTNVDQCRRGHPLDDVIVYKSGKRQCRTCHRAVDKARTERRRIARQAARARTNEFRVDELPAVDPDITAAEHRRLGDKD